MPPARGKKRKSEQSMVDDAPEMTSEQVPTKMNGRGDGPSPMKKRKVGITLGQKQALIDNLQLEITERARKLRANYNLHAQSLRTRIEIRINRIPTSLRKTKMGDLLRKCSEDQQKKATRAAMAGRPPVPEKDVPVRPASRPTTAASSTRHVKRISDEMAGGDKENVVEHVENPKKKVRGAAAAEAHRNPGQVLSPTSSNSRLVPRERPASPAKSMIARPASPVKTASATNLLSTMVERARATRTTATQRNATNTSATSSSNGSGTASSATSTTRTRRAAATTTTASSTRAAATRTARRVSGISESSDGSTSTVVRKRTAATTAKAAPAPAKKGGVMSTIRKGVTGTTSKKAAATKAAAPPATTTTGRVLRRRG
ncbi:hypothetical protein GQ53DRAFT_745149 [Thozetella sp. PMI_491]|nr:hypothetical protein GQ53DRAFT_745149 [Thozetella sp. PMI_491]